jgi:hypothetical protein
MVLARENRETFNTWQITAGGGSGGGQMRMCTMEIINSFV